MAKTARNGQGSGSPPNKSEAIREALAQNPAAKVKDIVAMLGTQGIKVQPSLVYMVKNRQQRQRKRARRERANAASRRTGTPNPIELVLKTKALAEEAGGIKNLKMLVDLLAE